MTSALDTVDDPFITPLLALLQDAINVDLAAEAPLSATPEPAVATTAPHPVALETLGETALPILSCYRVRSRSRRRTFGYVDQTLTLQFTYVSAATAREQLAARWPLLDRVWRAVEETLTRGAHPAHQDGAEVLEPLGIIEIPLQTGQKREFFQDGGDYTYPAFLAEIDVVRQTSSLKDPSTLYPALSFQTDLYIGDVREDAPDVSVISDESDLVSP